MKSRATGQLFSGYFIGRSYFALIRLLFTFPGMMAGVYLVVYAWTAQGIDESQKYNWSSKDLRYLKNEEISLEEKCKPRKVTSQTGERVQKLMCSPVERWHEKRQDVLLAGLRDSTISFKEFAKRNRKLKSEFFRKRREEKKNPDDPSIMESNLKAPRPVYVKDLGWTMPDS